MIIEKLVVKTGTACSLRCEKCGEFNPYLASKGKAYSLDAKTISQDIYRIAKTVEFINVVHVAGGEALLHSDLYLFLAFMNSISNIGNIEVVTNGTVIPDEITLDLLAKLSAKLVVLISDYGQSGVDNTKVIKKFEEFGVKYRLMKDMKWQDRSDVSNKKRDIEQLIYIALNCASYRKEPYFTLNNGIVSAHCPTAGSILYYLDIHTECEANYLDIRQVSDGELLSGLEKINNMDYLQMCNYCIPSWEVKYCQAGKQMEVK